MRVWGDKSTFIPKQYVPALRLPSLSNPDRYTQPHGGFPAHTPRTAFEGKSPRAEWISTAHHDTECLFEGVGGVLGLEAQDVAGVREVPVAPLVV